MKKLLHLLVFISGNFLFAQVGIGTDMPNPSTQLEIKSSNRGIMIPQVPLTGITDQSTISAGNIESLLVYNTQTNATLSPGYYYWYQNKWNRLLSDLPDYIVFWDVVNNHFTYIDQNGDVIIIDISQLETLTFLKLNADGHTLEYTDEDGVVTSIDLATVIDNFETLTTIVDNNNGTFTYTDEDGGTTTIDISNLETLTVLALNPDGHTLEYTDEDGVLTSIDIATIIDNFETLTTIVENNDGTFTYTDEAGGTTTVDISNLETLTVLALNPDGHTLEYTDEDGVLTSIDIATIIHNFETLTTIVENNDGTFTYTDEAGGNTTVDISNLETLTVLALNPDGHTLEYTDEDGVLTSIDIATIIHNFETLTTIVENNDGTFTYTDEAGGNTTVDISNLETLTVLALNPDGHTLEYTDEDGVLTSIDIATIIDNFETLTTIVENNDGTFTYTDEAGGTTTVDISNLETLTVLALNPDGHNLEYTDEDGVLTSIDLETVIDNFETLTTIVDNGNGTFTYTDEDNVTTTIDVSNLETLTTLALNIDGKTLEYTDEDGVLTSIDLETVIDNFETLTTIVDNGNGTFTYTDEDNVTTTIDVSNLETLTTLALNIDGKTLEYTDEDGVLTSIDLETVIDNFETLTTIVDNGNGTFTYTDEDNVTTTIDVANLETLTTLALNIDGKTLEYTDEDGVLTSIDLETVIDNFETLTTIVDNGNGTFTYTDEDNVTTTIDVSNLETLTTLALNIDGKTLEYTDEDGVLTSIDLETVIDNFETLTTIVDNGNGTFTYTDEDNVTTIIDVSNLETLTTLALNIDGKTLEYTDEDGVLTSIDLETVINNFETLTTIVDNGNGTFTYTDEDNVTTTIDVSNLETLTTLALNIDGKTLEYTDEDGVLTSIDLETVIDNFETLTKIINNGDGTYNYIDEDGVTTVLDANTTSVTVVDGVYTFLDGTNAVITTIDTNANAIIFDNTTNGFTATDVQAAIEELYTTITAGGAVTLEDNLDGTITLKSDSGVDLGTIAKANLTDNTDGSYIFSNADGTDIEFDVLSVDVSLNTTTNQYEFKDSDGNVIGSIDMNANNVAFDNSTNGFTATDVQAAIEELYTTITAGGGVTLEDNLDGTITLKSDSGADLGTIAKANLTDNTDGSYIFSNADGTDIEFDVLSVDVSLNTTTNQYEFKDSDGNVIGSIDMNANNVAFDNTTNGFTATDVQAAIEELYTTITAGGGVTLEDNLDGTITLKSDSGADLGTIAKANLTDNTDGSYIFSNADGTDIEFDVLSVDVSLNTTTNQYEFKDSDGNVIGSIDMNANNVAFDNTTNGFTATDVQAAIEELYTTITAGGGVTLEDNLDGTITLKSDSGADLGTIAKANLTDNTDGSYIFSNADGTDIEFDVLSVDVSLNTTTNQYEFKDSDGNVIGSIDMNANNVAFDNSTNGFTATDVQAAIEELYTTITAGGGVTLEDNLDGTITLKSDSGADLGTIAKANLTDNTDGSYIFSNADGTDIEFDVLSVDVSLNTTTNQYEFKDSDGNVIGSIDMNANNVAFDNSTNGFTATDVQAAIEELYTTITAGGGVTLEDNLDGTITLKSDSGADLGTIAKANLTDNTDGSYIFSNADGTDIEFDVLSVDVSLNTTTNQYEFKDSDGNVIGSIDMNANNVAFDNTTNGFTATDVQAAIEELYTTITAGGGVTLEDNLDGTITLKSDSGADLGTIAKANLTDNTDGSYIFSNANGTDIEFDVLSVDVSLNTTTNQYEFKDSDGNVIGSIDMNANNVAFDNTTNGFTATDVQAAIEELYTTITAGGGVTLEDNLDGTITLKSDSGADLGTIAKANLTDNTDGSYIFSNADGTDIEFDVLSVDVSLNTTTNQYEFKDSDGNVIGSIDMNANNVAFDNSTNGFTATDVQAAIEEINTTITNAKGDLTLDGGLEFTGATNGLDKLLADAGIQIKDGGITTAKLADNAVTSAKIGDGEVKTADIEDAAVTTSKIDGGTEGQLMVTNALGDVIWTDQSNIVPTTTNALTSTVNTMTSVVNGESASASIINTVTNSINNTELVTSVNGVSSVAVDLTTAIQDGQTTSTVADGNNTTVTSTTAGYNTEYKVNISKAAIQNNQKVTEVDAGTGITVNEVVAGDVTTYTVAADLDSIELSGDVTGPANATVVEAIQGTAVSATAPNEIGQALVYNGTVWIPGTPKIDSGDVTDAKDLTAADASIIVTDGTGATLVDANVKVADGGISTVKIADGAVTTAKIADGAVTTAKIADAGVTNVKIANDAVTTSKILDGEVKTADIANLNVTAEKINENVAGTGLVKNTTTNALDVKANNGLNVDVSADAVQLGGALIKPTTVTTTAANTLAVAGLQTGTTSDKIVVVEPNGVLRQVNSAMPKFFYMPAIIFDTSVNGNFTKNLHQEYLGQFTGSSNPTLVRSSGAPTAIPNLPTATDLYYYVTYYDPAVFSNVSVDANGVLSYRIIAAATDASYMTIIFVVK